MRLRAPTEQMLEWRERTARFRSAARQGKSSMEIAGLHDLPVAAVDRVLAPIEHPRIYDPVRLLRGQDSIPWTSPADVQLNWSAFLMVAGHVCGHTSSLALVLTLDDA